MRRDILLGTVLVDMMEVLGTINRIGIGEKVAKVESEGESEGKSRQRRHVHV